MASVGLGFFARKWKLELAETLNKNVLFPKEVVVEHWGKKHVIPLMKDPGKQRLGYPCPFCGDWIFRPENIPKHLRQFHQEEGRFEWNVSADAEKR
jgi:hypothetical protein